jgi:hypothetical protein
MIIDPAGQKGRAAVMTRAQLLWCGQQHGPMLLLDPEATTFVPARWMVKAQPSGAAIVERLVRA